MKNKIIFLTFLTTFFSVFLNTCAHSQQYTGRIGITENEVVITNTELKHSRINNDYFPLESRIPAGTKYLTLFSQENGKEKTIDTLWFYPADTDSLGFQIRHNKLYVYYRLYHRLHDSPTGSKTNQFDLVISQYNIGDNGIEFDNKRLFLESKSYSNLEQSTINFTDKFAIVKTPNDHIDIDLSSMSTIKNDK